MTSIPTGIGNSPESLLGIFPLDFTGRQKTTAAAIYIGIRFELPSFIFESKNVNIKSAIYQKFTKM